MGNIDGAMIWLTSFKLSGHHNIKRKKHAELSQICHTHSSSRVTLGVLGCFDSEGWGHIAEDFTMTH